VSENWSAKTLNYCNGKVSFDEVNIPCAESAFALTNFCRKLEKQNLGFNFKIENVEFNSKDDSDALVRAISKFPYNVAYDSILIWKADEAPPSQTAEEAFIESLDEDVAPPSDPNPFQESN